MRRIGLSYQNASKDIYGKGLLAYQLGNREACFTVESNIAETEEWQVSIFFRDYKEMPELERIALNMAYGTILDIGAGAGSHSLYLQNQGLQVHSLDLSIGAVEVMKQRGVKEVINSDFFDFQGKRYDTLLLLMNGIGIAGNIENLPLFFRKSKELLSPKGSIILDSSDLLYLFTQDDGSVMIDLNAPYYGELEYCYQFENEQDFPFPWLFVDFPTLSFYAEQSGFVCEKIYEDEHYHYLARLKEIV